MSLNDIDDSRDGMARYLERNPCTSFVAEIGGALVGTVMCGHDGRSGYIFHACVAQGYQREGVGARLVEAALAALKAEGITHATLHVLKGNKPGAAFWGKQGFAPFGVLEYHSKDLVPLIWYDPDYLSEESQ
jgi:ribosomal protein S18 acetylase RimI-like enzyme